MEDKIKKIFLIMLAFSLTILIMSAVQAEATQAMHITSYNQELLASYLNNSNAWINLSNGKALKYYNYGKDLDTPPGCAYVFHSLYLYHSYPAGVNLHWCRSSVRALASSIQANFTVDQWIRGKNVMPSIQNIPLGTVIATFLGTNNAYLGHTCIFEGYTTGGINVCDCNWILVSGMGVFGYHAIGTTNNGVNISDKIQNANNYYMVMLPITSGYTLAVTIQGSGTVVKVPDQANYTYSQVVQVTANPAAGWVFNHWAGDLTGSTSPASITMNGNKSVIANFTQINNPPNTPTTLTATATSSSSIYLTFTKGLYANNTYVERNTSSSWARGAGTVVYNSTGSDFNNTGLTSSTHYYYQAWGYGYSSYSTTYKAADATTKAGGSSPPSVPTSFTAGSPTLTTISLSWTKGTGATNTYVERNTVSSWARGAGTFVYNNTGTSTTDTGLNSGTLTTMKHGVLLTAVDTRAMVLLMQVVVQLTFTPICTSSFTASVISITEIDLTWTKGTGAVDTRIERNSISSWALGAGTLIYNNTGTSYRNTGLTTGTKYYYEAWSFANTDGYSGYSTSYATASGATTKEYERYIDTRTDAYNIYGARWKAQTFTVGNTGSNLNHYVNNVSLFLEKVGSPTGYFNVSIKAVAGGKPIGADLAFGQIFCSSVSAAGYGWYSISFITPYLLSASTTYCIVGRADSCTLSSQ